MTIIEDNNQNPTDEDNGGDINTGHADGDGTLQDGQATPSTDDQAIHAFKTGAAEVSNPDIVPTPEPLANDPNKSAADVAAAAADKAVKDTAAAGKAATEAPATTTAVDAVKTEQAEKAEFDKKVQTEIEELRLKPGSRAATRFQEMSNTIREQETFKPVREALEKAGVKDVATAELMLDASARGIQWEDAIHTSTATKDQFASAMTVIRCMNSRDPKLLNVAFDAMYGQLQDLAKSLGRELPGSVDPLEQFPDLKKGVEDGDITPAFAAEQARLRATTRMSEQTSQENAQQQADRLRQEKEYTDGMRGLNAYSDSMQSSDPQFQQKLAIISPALAAMRTTVHPSNWASFAKTLYDAAVVPVAAAAIVAAPAARPRVTHVPARTGVPARNLQRDPVNELDAFKAGVEGLQQNA